jgi:antitoxin ParD1/3/4
MASDMEINLDKELSGYIDGKVKSGQYGSPSDVVASALRVMRHIQQLQNDLKQAVAEGVAQLDRGEGVPWDIDEIKAEFLAQWQQQKKVG